MKRFLIALTALLYALPALAQIPQRSVRIASTDPIKFVMMDTATGNIGQTGKAGSITLKIKREGASAATGAGTISEVDAANIPGVYTYTPTSTETASGVRSFLLHATCSGCVDRDLEILLVATDYANGVTGGLTALPNAIPGAAGGIIVAGTGTNQISPDGTGAVTPAMGATLPTTPTANTVGQALFAGAQRLGRVGTAQGGSTTTIRLDASASATDNLYQDYMVKITSGLGAGQFRTIIGYTGSNQTATIDTRLPWSIAPDNTSVFAIFPAPMVDVALWNGTAPNALISGNVPANVQATASTLNFNHTGQTTKYPATVATGDGADSATALTRIGTPTGASLSADIAAIKTDSGNLITRLTSTRAGNLDFLDASILSRMATFTYTTPPTVAAIRTEIDTNSTQLAKIGTPAGASVSADIAAIKTDSGNLATRVPSALTISGGKVATTLNVSDFTGTMPANILQIAGQTATAAAGVTFPASIGTSTYAGGAVASVTGAVGSVVGDVGGKVLGGGSSTFIANGAQVSATVAGNVTVGAYASGQDPATYILATPANKLVTSATGKAAATIAAGDGADASTLVGRLTSTRAGNLDFLDASILSRMATFIYTAPPSASANAAAVWGDTTAYGATTKGAALAAAGSAGNPWTDTLTTYVSGQAGYILLHNLDAPVSTRSTYTGSDTSGTTTLLGLLTSTRANKLDFLDASILSRMATFSYTAPPSVGAIRSEMDSNSTQLAKLGTPAGASVSADVAALKADTSSLTARIPSALTVSGGKVASTLSASDFTGTIPASVAGDVGGKVLGGGSSSFIANGVQTAGGGGGGGSDPWAASLSAYTDGTKFGGWFQSVVNAALTAVKAQTDQFTFTSGNVNSHVKAMDTAVQNAIAAAVLNSVIDGSVTLKQAQAVNLAIATGNYTVTLPTAPGQPATNTYKRRDGATTIATVTVYFTSDGKSITSRVWTLSNLP